MASSIRIGVNEVLKQFDPHIIALSVIDQPFISADIYNDLLSVAIQSNNIVASKYSNNVIGVPAAFPKNISHLLLTLSGDRGARDLFYNPQNKIEIIDFPEVVSNKNRDSND